MRNTRLAALLLSMAKVDQAMREESVNDMSLWDASVDKKHTQALKTIINKYGWPTISLVGEQASNAAWLLVQHADHDPHFQENCLATMKSAATGEVSLTNLAYLEDRVRCAQGRPQLYGTQFDNPGKEFGPKLVEDEANLDERRKSMGLSSLKEYRKLMVEYYGDSR